jgi:hypothetical protein
LDPALHAELTCIFTQGAPKLCKPLPMTTTSGKPYTVATTSPQMKSL